MTTFCVTGAGGSIGSELCVQLAKQHVQHLKLVSLTENGLYQITKTLRRKFPALKLTGVLGSVEDTRLMYDTLRGVDVVVHAAAHKHVPICEENPLAAIANNVGGTYSAAKAAREAGVGYFVFVSSDKAVFPQSVMGSTKRASELIIRDLMNGGPCHFFTVRFGNVLDSAGSVLPLWREQIKAGGPLVLTDPQCERYFMSIPEAVELILGSLTIHKQNPINRPYIFDMGKAKVMGEMAQQLMRDMRKQVPIKEIGLRPGEKVYESLFHGGELLKTSHTKIFQVAEDGTKILTAKQLLELLSAVNDRDTAHALIRLRDIVL